MKPKTVAKLDRELHWMGGVLGRQRDLDVLDDLLRSISDDRASLRGTSVLVQLHKHRRDESRQVARFLRTKRYRRLLDRLDESVTDPPLRQNASEPACAMLLPGLQGALSTLFRTVDELGPAPSNEDLHRVRIMAKQCRYSADISSSFLGASAEDVANSLAKVQTVLGDLHDRVVATTYLEGIQLSALQSGDPLANEESVTAAIDWLRESLDSLKPLWREPFEHARTSGESIVRLR